MLSLNIVVLVFLAVSIPWCQHLVCNLSRWYQFAGHDLTHRTNLTMFPANIIVRLQALSEPIWQVDLLCVILLIDL